MEKMNECRVCKEKYNKECPNACAEEYIRLEPGLFVRIDEELRTTNPSYFLV